VELNGSKVVLLLGAGATVADVATKPRKARPPLDRSFFTEARLTHAAAVGGVRRYLQKTYHLDLLTPEHDRLESVMALIYTDLFNPLLNAEALPAFRQLLRLFNRRLATTTNGIRPTNKRLVYRIISTYLAAGVAPSDLTVITFNQDIQVEKMLDHMSAVSRWKALAAKIFAFPHLYAFPDEKKVTFPKGETDLFAVGGDADGCIRLLKLHGSLNWYSSHANTEPSQRAMFNPTRQISITRRRTISPQMTLQSTQRSMYTLPVVVPPVNHKSSVLHRSMADLWQLAEARLRTADEIVIFGYSCPPLDFESSSELRRSQVGRTTPANISVIDPAPSVPERYITLLDATCLHYYASAHDFLSHLG
jgi:hypothetical protein